MFILDLERNIEIEKWNVRCSYYECLLRAEAVLLYFPHSSLALSQIVQSYNNFITIHRGKWTICHILFCY